MPCLKEKPNNNQCRNCQIKHLVVWDGKRLVLPKTGENVVHWQVRKGNAWLGIPDSVSAHCGIGLSIILADK